MNHPTSSTFTTIRIAFIYLLLSSAAFADPIVYTIEGVGTGMLGPNPFTETHFTLSATADTNQITSPLPRIFLVPDLTSTISITGIGMAAFTIPTATVVNQNNPSAGMGAPSRNLTILAVTDSAFQSYDLSTSIGPIEGMVLFNPGATFATTAGFFSLTSVTSATFQAQVVPEPSSLSLAILGSIAVGYYRRRQTLLCKNPTAKRTPGHLIWLIRTGRPIEKSVTHQ